MPDIQKALKDLRSEFGAVASAVISRDGILLAADMPEGVTAETFTIMCATMVGAASTAHSALKIAQPKVVHVLSEKYEMFALTSGRKAIVVTVVPHEVKVDELIKHMEATAAQMAEQ